MFYVYILKLGVSRLYIGYTGDLRRRLQEHKQGRSTYTRTRGPITLIYYEAFQSRGDAIKRERNLKKYKSSYSQLKRRLYKSLSNDTESY